MSSDSDCKKGTRSFKSRLVPFIYIMFDSNNKILYFSIFNFYIIFLVVDGCTRTVVVTHQIYETKPIVVKEK